MTQDLEPRSGGSLTSGLGKKAVALVVIVVAGYVLLRVALHLVAIVALPLMAIVAVVGIIWAWNALRD